MKTGVEAFKLAASGFIVPFIYAFDPVLLMQGTPFEVVIAGLSALIGIYLLSAGLQGWYFGKASWPIRIVLIASAFLLIVPGTATDIGGVVIGALLFVIQKFVINKPKRKIA